MQNIFIFALTKKGLVAQLNSALDYGSRGYRFESCRGHKKKPYLNLVRVFYLKLKVIYLKLIQ